MTVITANALNTLFDAQTTQLTTNMVAGKVDFCITVGPKYAAGTYFVDFLCADDFDLQVLRVHAEDGPAGVNSITASLTQTDGDESFVEEHDVSVALADINPAEVGDEALDMRSTSQPIRLCLLKGVRYRLSLVISNTMTGPCFAMLVLKTKMRTA